MKKLLFILILAIYISVPVFAQTGMAPLQVPEGSISSVDTTIDAKIENWGYNRIFVALPSGWVPDEMNSYATAYAVRIHGLWRIYGDPMSKTSLLGSGLVYTEEGTREKSWETVGEHTGVWLRPNEGAIIHFVIKSIDASGTVDPLKIEKEIPEVKVIKWEQEFKLTPSAVGFITAPWIVEGATLISSTPAPISDVNTKPSKMYYQDYEPKVEIEAPRWDEWLELKNSLAVAMSSRSTAPIKLEFPKIDKSKATSTSPTPVWRIDNFQPIYYSYEWKRGQRLEGITLSSPSFAGVPEWFEWF